MVMHGDEVGAQFFHQGLSGTFLSCIGYFGVIVESWLWIVDLVVPFVCLAGLGDKFPFNIVFLVVVLLLYHF